MQNREHNAAEIQEQAIADLRQYIGKQKIFADITLVVIKQQYNTLDDLTLAE